MPTKYVRPAGNNTPASPYDTWAKAANSLQVIIDGYAATADMTVEIAGGTYLEYTQLKATAAGWIIKATEDPLYSGNVIIDASGISNNPLKTTASTVTSHTLKGITWKAAYADTYNVFTFQSAAPGHKFYDCTFIGGARGIVYNGGTWERCKFRGVGNTNASGALHLLGAAASTYNITACQFVPDGNRSSGHIHVDPGAGVAVTVNMNNNLFDGVYKNYVARIASGTSVVLNAKNNAIGSVNYECAASAATISDVGVTSVITETNNFIAPCAIVAQAGYGITPHASDVLDVDPKITASGYNEGYINISVDDAANEAFAREIADACDAHDCKMTWYIDYLNLVAMYPTEAEQKASLRWFVDRGHEIGLHNYSGAQWGATQAFAATGPASSTIDVDVASDTITCYDPVNGTFTITAFSTKTIEAVRQEVDAFTGWSVGVLIAGITAKTLGSGLADTNGPQNSAAGYTLLLDISGATQGYLYDELQRTKDTLERIIGDGYVVKSGRPTNFDYSAESKAAARDIGLLGVSQVTTTGFASRDLRAFPIFACNAVLSTHASFTGKTEAVMKRAGRAFARHHLVNGMFTSILTHTISELTPQQISWFLDGAREVPGITLGTNASIYETIRSRSTPDADQYIWSRTFYDQSNPVLSSDSALIDKGTAWWGTSPNPVGADGEPFSNFDISIGPVQSQDTLFHPTKL